MTCKICAKHNCIEDHFAGGGKPIAEPVKQEPVQEPVAWGWVMDGEVNDCIGPSEHARCEGEYTVPLYSGPVDAEAIRAEALEEAKKACDEICQKAIDSGYTVKGETFIDGFGDGACACAAAIRGLK